MSPRRPFRSRDLHRGPAAVCSNRRRGRGAGVRTGRVSQSDRARVCLRASCMSPAAAHANPTTVRRRSCSDRRSAFPASHSAGERRASSAILRIRLPAQSVPELSSIQAPDDSAEGAALPGALRAAASDRAELAAVSERPVAGPDCSVTVFEQRCHELFYRAPGTGSACRHSSWQGRQTCRSRGCRRASTSRL